MTKAKITNNKLFGSSIAELKIKNLPKNPEVKGIPANENSAIEHEAANSGEFLAKPVNPLWF